MHILYALSTLFLQPLLTFPTTVLSPSSLRNDSSVPLLNATNITSSLLTGSDSHPSPILLTFDLFGSQIPSSAVNAAFSGATTRIYPFLQNRPDDPIANDDFRYRAIGGSVQISVTAVVRHGLSWRQLSSVLRQTSSFMNGHPGGGQPHMQELAFEIIENGTRVGEGLVSYRPSRGIQSQDFSMVNLKNANDTTLLVAPTDLSLDTPTANAIHFQIPNTPFKLIFGFLGDAIPVSSDVWTAFEGAHSQIVGSLGRHPASPIPGERFEYSQRGVRITVLVNRGTTMTWKQLSWVLGGMYGFMMGKPEHYQLLTCEISFTGHGNVGFASVWYYPPRLQVTERALLDTTVLVPNPQGVIRFPVPNTPIIITFKYFGLPIPWRELQDAILAALDQIGPSWRAHGADPMPGNHFFRALDGVRISIFANVPHVMSWIQLHDTVWGLMLFVTGAQGGAAYYRVLNFDVDDVRAGTLAYGMVRYSAPGTAESRDEESRL